MKARCPHCHGIHSTTATGLLRLHGSPLARCIGSGLETTVPPMFKPTVYLFLGIDTGHVEARGSEGEPLTGDAQIDAYAALEAAADHTGVSFESDATRVRATFASAPFALGLAAAELARRGYHVEVAPFYEHTTLPAVMRAA